MPDSINPTKARIVRDIKHYRAKLAEPGVMQEVREHLRGKAPPKYNPPGVDLTTGDAYRDFASFQPGPPTPFPNRLGGGLEHPRPPHLATLPDPNPGVITWKPKGHPNNIQVTVLQNGAVVHTKPDGTEDPDAHHYMHGIFDSILYDVRDKLEAINDALEKYADRVSDANPAPAEAGAYLAAITAFQDFEADLQPGGKSVYAEAFNSVGIAPVVTNEGFIVSCRVKLNWKNPYHSSSTIKIP